MRNKALIGKWMIIFLLVQSLGSVFAQYQYDEQEAPNYTLADQTKSDLMIITIAGLGGAVLGLSTLSFVEEPGDHADNILTGAAVGLIIGVIYVAYRQAYGPAGVLSAQSNWRYDMLKDKKDFLSQSSPKSPDFQWTWLF